MAGKQEVSSDWKEESPVEKKWTHHCMDLSKGLVSRDIKIVEQDIQVRRVGKRRWRITTEVVLICNRCKGVAMYEYEWEEIAEEEEKEKKVEKQEGE